MYTASGALRELHLLTPIFEAEYAAVPLHWLATGYLATGFSPPQNFYLVIPDKSDGLKFDASKPPTDRPTANDLFEVSRLQIEFLSGSVTCLFSDLVSLGMERK